MPIKRAGVTIESWKLPIFERVLKEDGFHPVNKGEIIPDVLMSHVEIEVGHAQRFAQTVLKASKEAAKQGPPEK